MKIILFATSIGLLAALAHAGPPGQGVTTPVGYASETIRPGMNLLGLTLHRPVLFTGTLAEVAPGSLTIAADAPPDLPLEPGRTHILEITSGEKAGVIQELTTWEGPVLTTHDDLAAAGVAPGDSFAIRRAPILDEIFHPSHCGLAPAAGDDTAADTVFIPQGATFGDFRQCILLEVPDRAPRWIDVATGAPLGALPLVYPDGLLVHRRGATPVPFTLPGEVKTGPTRTLVRPGLNLVATPGPGTLQSLGLEDDLAASDDPFEADRVWLADDSGSMFRLYFIDSSGHWRDAGDGEPVTTPVFVGTAILIERQAASTLLTFGD